MVQFTAVRQDQCYTSYQMFTWTNCKERYDKKNCCFICEEENEENGKEKKKMMRID